MSVKKFGIGQPIRRVEDHRLLTGGGRYLDDDAPDRLPACGRAAQPARACPIHRSPTLTTARAMNGVKLVLTAADVAHLGDVPCQAPCRTPTARRAISRTFRCSPRASPSMSATPSPSWSPRRRGGPRRAPRRSASTTRCCRRSSTCARRSRHGAPAVWSRAARTTSPSMPAMGDKAEVEDGLRQGDRVVPHRDREQPAHHQLHGDPRRRRGIRRRGRELHPDVSQPGRPRPARHAGEGRPEGEAGEGPGDHAATSAAASAPRASCTANTRSRRKPRAASAARSSGSPTASDHFTGDAQGRDNFSVGEVALRPSGRFLAMRFDILGNLGAYLSQFGPYIPYLGATMMTGVYGTPLIYVRVRGVYTNTVPVDAYRGAGRPEAAYLLERLVDRAARETRASKPDAIRAAELHPAPADALQDADRRPHLRHRRFRRSHMERAMELADWAGFKERLKAVPQGRQDPRHRHRHLYRMHGLGRGRGRRRCGSRRTAPSTVYSGTQSNGQGHATAYAQFAAAAPRPAARQDPRRAGRHGPASRPGNGTGGSRSIPIGGVSVYAASQRPRRQAEGARLRGARSRGRATSRSPTARCGSSAPTGASPSPSSRACRSATEEARTGEARLRAAERDLSERHAYRRGRDRPGHRRHRARALYDLRRFRRSP